MNRRGFTLIELVITIAIIGIFASVMVPNLTRFKANNNEVSMEAYEDTVNLGLRQYYVLQGKKISYANDSFYSEYDDSIQWMKVLKEEYRVYFNSDYEYKYETTSGDLYGNVLIKEK